MKSIVVFAVICNFLYASNYFMAVGIDTYENLGKENNLVGIKQDIKNIKQVAATLGVKDDEIDTFYNSNATKENIVKSFKAYIKSSKNKKENNFIFYFSGHGMQVKDENKDETDGYDEAFALYDLKLKGTTVITQGALIDDELYSLLAQIESKKILIFDKCCSGTSHRSINGYLKAMMTKFSLLPQQKDFSDGVYASGQKVVDLEDLENKHSSLNNNYLVLSATDDNQLAGATKYGSLFTTSLHDAIYRHKISSNFTLRNLQDFCSKNIKELAYTIKEQEGIKPLYSDFEPIFFPFDYLNRDFISLFIDTTYSATTPEVKPEIPAPPVKVEDTLAEDTLDLFISNNILKITGYKRHYTDEEIVTFKLRSTKSGYLNIFIAYKDSYRLFLENTKIERDKKYNFYKDFNDNKILMAKKSKGKTNIYIILSKSKIDIGKFIYKNKDKNLELTNKFRKALTPAIKYSPKGSIIGKKNPNITAISKISFNVK